MAVIGIVAIIVFLLIINIIPIMLIIAIIVLIVIIVELLITFIWNSTSLQHLIGFQCFKNISNIFMNYNIL